MAARQKAKSIGVAIAAGALGGGAAAALNLPLAWMLGALAGNLLAIALGFTPAIPMFIRRAVIAVIGVYLGAAFSPDLLENAARLLSSMLYMLLYVVALIAGVWLLLRRLLRLDGYSALCASAPGAYSMVIALAADHGDARAVTVVQTMRIVMIVTTLPVLAGYFVPPPPAPPAMDMAHQDDWLHLITLAALALPTAAAGIYRKWRIPFILALSLGLSAAAHTAGLDMAPLPAAPVNLALMLLGASIGCGFLVFRMGGVLRVLAAGFAAGAFGLTLAVCFAVLGAEWLGVSFWALLLALAPGGIAEISLIAITLNIDPTFVAVHQGARLAAVLLAMPLLAALAERRWPHQA